MDAVEVGITVGVTVALTVLGWWLAVKITLRGVHEAHVREVKSREWEHDLANVYRPLHAVMERLIAEEGAVTAGHALAFENGDFDRIMHLALLEDQRHGPLRADVLEVERRVGRQADAARAYHKKREAVVRGQWGQVLATETDAPGASPQLLEVFLTKDRALDEGLAEALARGDVGAWREEYAHARSRRSRGPPFTVVGTTFEAMYEEARGAAAAEREAYEKASRELLQKARRVRDGLARSIREEATYASLT